MVFTHYRWTEGEDGTSIFTGEPSRRAFDPYNGNQVLFLINYYISVNFPNKKFSPGEARAIESRLAYDLPLTPKSERSVYHWLTQEISNN